MTDRPAPPAPPVAILADDLIWSARLADGVRRAGSEPVVVRSAGDLAGLPPSVAGCIVDLTARAYDGPAAVAAAVGAGLRVIAVGQHDDAELRRAARAAGAARVYAYRTLAEHGERELRAWVASLRGPRGDRPVAGVPGDRS